jgi:hypothetical protein
MGEVIDDVIARGDLSKLTPEQRVVHYHNVCRDLGLNPNTEPFGYITLQGKLVLYAKRTATDQLRKVNGINIQVVDRVVNDGMLTVHVRAEDKHGRTDEDFGCVSIIGLRGEAAANAMMKAITKAKRRVTLSISGLGYADESEIEARTPAFSNLTRNTGNPQMRLTDEAATQKVDEAVEAAADMVPDEAERLRFAERAATKPFAIPRDSDHAADWSAWGQTLMSFIRAAPDADAVNNWTTANADDIAVLQNHDTAKYRRLMDMIDHQIAMRSEQQE